MTWYRKKGEIHIPTYHNIQVPNNYKQSGFKCNTSNQVSMTLTITNMHSNEDFEKIKKALLGIIGVNDVQKTTNIKKLVVNFDISKTNLTVIAHTIANLGYKYLQRG